MTINNHLKFVKITVRNKVKVQCLNLIWQMRIIYAFK